MLRAVVGLGNPLMGDDALGITVIDLLEGREEVRERAELIKAGTDMLILLEVFEKFKRVIIVDVIRGGKEAGSVYSFRLKEEALRGQSAFSTHTVSLPEIIKMAHTLRGNMPDIFVTGIEPYFIGRSEGLSEKVKKSIPSLLDLIIKILLQD